MRNDMIRPIPPGPGQESVWDYPRPPIVESVPARLRVEFAGQTIADTTRGLRVLETSHPPVYYIHPEDVIDGICQIAHGTTFCEFKGTAVYWDLQRGGQTAHKAAWSYPDPARRFSAIRYYLAFYVSRVDACWVGDEKVFAQDGDFYGGWITPGVVGPFKGAPGTLGW